MKDAQSKWQHRQLVVGIGAIIFMLAHSCLVGGCLMLEGSGQTVTYTVAPTQGVVSLSIQDAFQVTIQEGSEDRFTIAVDDNLRAFVDITEETPGEWSFRLLSGVQYKPRQLRVVLTLKTIANITLQQNASVEVLGSYKTKQPLKIKVNDNARLRWAAPLTVGADLTLELRRNAQVSFSDLQLGPDVTSICRCQGGVLTAKGLGTSFSLSAKERHVSQLSELLLQTMDVELSDESAADVAVQQTLTVSLLDRSSLSYIGQPNVQTRVKERSATITQKKAGK